MSAKPHPRTRRKKALHIGLWLISGTLVVVIAAGLAFLIAVKSVIPRIAAHRIKDAVESHCKSCTLEIGSLAFSISQPDHLVFENVHLVAGDANITLADATAEKIIVDLSMRKLLHREVFISKILVEKPQVVLTDGEGHSKSDDSAPEYYPFRSLSTVLTDGTFTYIRHYKGTTAVLHIHEINGSVGELGTTPELLGASTDGHLSAQIEKSGHIDLQVAAYIFKRPLYVDVKVEILKQNLADVTPFFKHNDGVFLKGVMLEGRSGVFVRGQKLNAWVWAKYAGLDVTLRRTQERSGIVAFFTNLGEDLTMNTKNLDMKKSDQTRSVQLEREHPESLVSFILRGMKEAAIKVAMAAPSAAKPKKIEDSHGPI